MGGGGEVPRLRVWHRYWARIQMMWPHPSPRKLAVFRQHPSSPLMDCFPVILVGFRFTFWWLATAVVSPFWSSLNFCPWPFLSWAGLSPGRVRVPAFGVGASSVLPPRPAEALQNFWAISQGWGVWIYYYVHFSLFFLVPYVTKWTSKSHTSEFPNLSCMSFGFS